MSHALQEHYQRLGYPIALDGAVEYYYVVFRTHRQTRVKELCINGGFSWSSTEHNPSKAMQILPEQDGTYRYSRLGPFPNRAMAEAKAMEFALHLFNDPTHYGIGGTDGLREIHPPDYRVPHFR